tara:strand:+ start:443 stop:742 length:300 start_codon:yes stop_codon:yes gene_type:complete
MRKITQEACFAFEYAYADNFNKSNTRVVRSNEVAAEMYLHGNLIAYSNETGIYISNAGYKTNTTKERLNGLTGVHIEQKDFVWYLNGEAWNGDWIRIGD